jgi:tetratricopeptide (TPR) repeat protein
LTQPLLSAALIVRDEEQHLPACLESLAGVVDDVVVVDTGSRDRSVEIARGFGAEVFEFPWCADFSAARNHGLDRARGRWILYIDADERLEPVERASVERLLDDDGVVAYRLWLRPRTLSTAYREYRLWRSDPRIRFVGVIHEKVHGALLRVAAADRRRIADCELRLAHVGYDGDQAAKHRRNLPLLEAQLDRDPNDIYNWHHLGLISVALGDYARGEAAYRRALELALSRDPPETRGRLAYSSLLVLLMARGEDTRELAEEAIRHYPQDWALVWHRAQAHSFAGDWEAALADLDRLVALDPDAIVDHAAYERSIFGDQAQAARGLCLFKLGRYDESEAAYAAAERELPGTEELRVKRQLAAARARAAHR